MPALDIAADPPPGDALAELEPVYDNDMGHTFDPKHLPAITE